MNCPCFDRDVGVVAEARAGVSFGDQVDFEIK